MVAYLHQCFTANFTNSFELQSLNYDPDMFYSLNTFLLPSSFVLISSRWRCCIGAPSGEIMVWLISSCTDHISNNDYLINYINLSPAMA